MKKLVLGVTKSCQITHNEGDESQRGVGMLLTNFLFTAYSQLPSVLNRLRTIVSRKSGHFPFRIVWVLYTFLQ